MAYEKQVWNCGDTITAEKMNHIEEGIENAQSGYECTSSEVTLVSNETISTSEENTFLSYTNLIDADTLVVYFDGTRYECPKISGGSAYNAYGGYSSSEEATDFSEYPFAICSAIETEVPTRRNIVYTETAGTHTIELKVVSEVVSTTECFEKAVKKFTGYECKETLKTLTEESIASTGMPPIAYLSYTQLIDASSITVTFDGTEYVLGRTTGLSPFNAPAYVYGDANNPSSPFRIFSTISSSDVSKRNGVLVPPPSGTHTIKIEVAEGSVTTTPCFEKAVKSVAKGGRLIKKVGAAACNPQYDEYDISLTEMQNLVLQGVPMMIETTSGGESVYKQILNYIFSSDRAELIVVSDSSLALAEMTLYANNGADGYMDSGRCNLG